MPRQKRQVLVGVCVSFSGVVFDQHAAKREAYDTSLIQGGVSNESRR
jgi:hypothetical protein